MVISKVFTKRDLLPDNEFKIISEFTHQSISIAKGYINISNKKIIDEQYTFRPDTVDTGFRPIYKVGYTSQNESIDDFAFVLGDIFNPLLRAIQNVFLENNCINPRPYFLQLMRNNSVPPWHYHHPNPTKGPKQKNYVATYYFHPDWDINYGGDFNIGLTEDIIFFSTPCFSNSLVIQSMIYGHSNKPLKKGFKGNRDVMVSHWVTD